MNYNKFKQIQNEVLNQKTTITEMYLIQEVLYITESKGKEDEIIEFIHKYEKWGDHTPEQIKETLIDYEIIEEEY